jgi:hypothetical protein
MGSYHWSEEIDVAKLYWMASEDICEKLASTKVSSLPSL